MELPAIGFFEIRRVLGDVARRNAAQPVPVWNEPPPEGGNRQIVQARRPARERLVEAQAERLDALDGGRVAVGGMPLPVLQMRGGVGQSLLGREPRAGGREVGSEIDPRSKAPFGTNDMGASATELRTSAEPFGAAPTSAQDRRSASNSRMRRQCATAASNRQPAWAASPSPISSRSIGSPAGRIVSRPRQPEPSIRPSPVTARRVETLTLARCTGRSPG
mgnify:CR=1 FL=1